VTDLPPAYHLVSGYRSSYRLEKLGITMGFVATAFGCPHRCSFCCIQGQTGGSYLTKSVATRSAHPRDDSGKRSFFSWLRAADGRLMGGRAEMPGHGAGGLVPRI